MKDASRPSRLRQERLRVLREQIAEGRKLFDEAARAKRQLLEKRLVLRIYVRNGGT